MEERMLNENVYIYIPNTGVNDLAIATYKIIMYGSKQLGPSKENLKVHFVETEEDYLVNQIIGLTSRNGKNWVVIGTMNNIQSFIEHYYGFTPPSKHEYHRFIRECIRDTSVELMDAIDFGSELEEDKERDELTEANNYPFGKTINDVLTTKDLDCGFLLREVICRYMLAHKDEEDTVGYCQMLISLKVDEEKVEKYKETEGI